MNRIEKKFSELKKEGQAALIAYIASGDPCLSITGKLVEEFESRGVDIIELGVPFSDPIADGPTIQRASGRALKKGIDLPKIFGLVNSLRGKRKVTVPIVLMTYYNPVYKYGVQKFARDASRAGVDGVIVPDLPPEEARDLIVVSRALNFHTIFLLAPTSTTKREALVAKTSTGFIYYVSLTGVTGVHIGALDEVAARVKEIKSMSGKPVCVGFGISTPREVSNIARIADGVIVGSAIIKVIEKNIKNPHLVRNVGRFVGTLIDAVKSA